MSKVNLDVDEIIATINHSSLPTLLVEGKDDFEIYRWIEEKITDLDIEVLPCQGRKNLLKIYDRRNEIENKHILFLADKDMWLFDGVPPQYSDIIFTDGYSIENDIYSAAQSKIEALIPKDLAPVYSMALEEYCKWFGYEVDLYLQNKEFKLDFNIKEIIANDKKRLSPHFLLKRSYKEVDEEFSKAIFESYTQKIRGKSLMDLWEWFVEEKSLKRGTLFEITFIFIEENTFVMNVITKIKQSYTDKEILQANN